MFVHGPPGALLLVINGKLLRLWAQVFPHGLQAKGINLVLTLPGDLFADRNIISSGTT